MSDEITVTLWGVRGSVPSPGPRTQRIGGNTSCVSVEFGDQMCLVLDAGTGIRRLGVKLAASKARVYVLLTHSHWDHVQGFPFFTPIYQPKRPIVHFPSPSDEKRLVSLLDQMDGAHFPVKPEHLPCDQTCVMTDPMGYLNDLGIDISRIATNHPGGCFAYKIRHGGRAFVYIPDNELDWPGKVISTPAQISEFCAGADHVIHDSQYLPADMPMKRGWGHSVLGHVLEMAASACLKHLILFHHDPERSDDELDQMQADARRWLAAHAPATSCTAGFEGMTFKL
ncbi:MAG: MBL fold metallo-hydrolase [Phycisphaerae bacterium]|nr:MBL fold metallo-hydrolase [Phycisphaerae bacterium]